MNPIILPPVGPSGGVGKYDNTMYQHISGIAVDRPLGAAMDDIFVGFQMERQFEAINKQFYYVRYVNDIFVTFSTRPGSRRLFHAINQLHPALKFTGEFENNCLPLLYFLVESIDFSYLTSVYRKPIFIGSYIGWGSFGSLRRKINLIKTLIYRSLIICSMSKLIDKSNLIETLKKWISWK